MIQSAHAMKLSDAWRQLAVSWKEPMEIVREKTTEELIDEITRRPTMDELWKQYANEQELEPDALTLA